MALSDCRRSASPCVALKFTTSQTTLPYLQFRSLVIPAALLWVLACIPASLTTDFRQSSYTPYTTRTSQTTALLHRQASALATPKSDRRGGAGPQSSFPVPQAAEDLQAEKPLADVSLTQNLVYALKPDVSHGTQFFRHRLPSTSFGRPEWSSREHVFVGAIEIRYPGEKFGRLASTRLRTGRQERYAGARLPPTAHSSARRLSDIEDLLEKGGSGGTNSRRSSSSSGSSDGGYQTAPGTPGRGRRGSGADRASVSTSGSASWQTASLGSSGWDPREVEDAVKSLELQERLFSCCAAFAALLSLVAIVVVVLACSKGLQSPGKAPACAPSGARSAHLSMPGFPGGQQPALPRDLQATPASNWSGLGAQTTAGPRECADIL